MKLGTSLSVRFAAAALLALAAPAQAQQRGHGGGGMRGGAAPSMMNHGNPGVTASRGNGSGVVNNGSFRGGRGRFVGGRYYRGGYYRGGVNVYVGGFYPYYYGYPYFGLGYPYAYYYPPYYGYTYDPQGVYEGRVVNPESKPTREREVDPKDQSSVEAQVQEQLAQAGYYHGPIDGVVGEGTRRAIRSYERANGLRVDGQIDNQLLSTMGIS